MSDSTAATARGASQPMVSTSPWVVEPAIVAAGKFASTITISSPCPMAASA
jgi:hypothetical protein